LPTHLTPRGAHQYGAFARRGRSRCGGLAGGGAQQKISQADAKYQGTPKDDQHCDGCVNFQPPNACKFVEGDISPSGWCQLFAAKTKS
jgi:hypothetical protein